jgi:nitrogen fixation protein NifU and related proteins
MIDNKTNSANGHEMKNQLYQEELLDHYRFPRNCGILENPDIATKSFNPSCGDAISLHACIADNILTQIKFQGQGCVISQAAVSMLTERVINQPLAKLQQITKDDILAMIGIALGPTRLRCALLGLEALHEAVAQYIIAKKS